MNYIAKLLYFVLPLTACMPQTLLAGVLSTTGNVAVIPRPADARKGVLESDTHAWVWAEAQQTTLSDPLAVDLNSPGDYKLTGLSTSYLPPGTALNSYYFSFDSIGDDQATGSGSITFDQPILAIVARNTPETHLDASNFLGEGTLFTTGESFIGLDGSETISLSSDRRTFSYDLLAVTPGDHFRFLTEVPEPTGLPVLVGIVLLTHRRAIRACYTH